MNNNKWILAVAMLWLSYSSNAQCNKFFPLGEGAEWKYENYNAKDKLQGSQSQKITEFNTTDKGYIATMEVQTFDKKGDEINTASLEFTCDGGKIYFDMRRFVSEEQLKALDAYELEINSTNLEYPESLSSGTTLEDGQISITAKGSPIPMKMQVNIVDRKVVALEEINSPAGTFKAYKITSTSVIENQMGINMTFEFEQIEWVAENTGMVRSESYRKGKLESYMLLVDKKP